MRKSEEHDEQVMLMQWWALQCKFWKVPEECLFAIPNGGERNAIVAKRLKEEGVRAGIPDLFLAYPSGNIHGLFIEMKKPKGGRVSENQKKVIATLNNNGYYAVVANGFEWARTAIVAYLNGNLKIV
jgi:hypothetical protein